MFKIDIVKQISLETNWIISTFRMQSLCMQWTQKERLNCLLRDYLNTSVA